MVGLLFIGIIAVIVGLYMKETNKGGRGDPKNQFMGKLASIAGVVIIVISIIAGAFTAVPAGNRGVVIRFNAVTGTVLEEGLQMKLPFLDSVVMMDIRTDKYEVGAASASMDLQDVSTTIALNWRLEPTRTAEIYRTLGMEYINRIAAPAVQEVIKQVKEELRCLVDFSPLDKRQLAHRRRQFFFVYTNTLQPFFDIPD